jgi:hypothetical protein
MCERTWLAKGRQEHGKWHARISSQNSKSTSYLQLQAERSRDGGEIGRSAKGRVGIGIQNASRRSCEASESNKEKNRYRIIVDHSPQTDHRK